MTTPRDVTMAIIEDELPGIRAYAIRHSWTVEWRADSLSLVFGGQHPQDKTPVDIIAAVDGYRALAPGWTFNDPSSKRATPEFFPRAGTLPNGRSSIFHSNRCICAPFNRLAYRVHGGPHSDWNGPEAWLEVRRPGEVHAVRIANMFAVILAHLAVSPGMN